MAEETQSGEVRTPKLEKAKEISLPTAVLAVEVAADGKTAFAACQDGGVFSVDLETGKPEPLGKHGSYASGVALLPDGQTLSVDAHEVRFHTATLRP